MHPKRPRRRGGHVFPRRLRPCPARPQCTTSSRNRRQITTLPRDLAHAQAAARAAGKTIPFQADYARRAGVEGAMHQAASHGARRARYRGLPEPASTTCTWPARSTFSGWRHSGPARHWTGSGPATWHASNSASPHDPAQRITTRIVLVAGCGARRHRERVGFGTALPVIFWRSTGEARVRVRRNTGAHGRQRRGWRRADTGRGQPGLPGVRGRLARWGHARNGRCSGRAGRAGRYGRAGPGARRAG
jgi:hypothetical protein